MMTSNYEKWKKKDLILRINKLEKENEAQIKVIDKISDEKLALKNALEMRTKPNYYTCEISFFTLRKLLGDTNINKIRFIAENLNPIFTLYKDEYANLPEILKSAIDSLIIINIEATPYRELKATLKERSSK